MGSAEHWGSFQATEMRALKIIPKSSCLEQLAHQTAMKDNMDYLYIDTLYQRCKQQINELQKTNSNPHIAASLESLLGTLDFQESTLKSRHRQRMISEPSLNHPMDEHGHRNRHCRFRHEKLAVEDMMITPDQMDSDATLDSVAGLEEAKQILQEAVVMPAHYPQLFQNGTKPWTRMLLYGPPGTGKTRLAKALANELKCTFFCVSPASLLSCLIGESEKLIRDLFKTARNESGQSVIFFDEIDSLCRRRTQNEDEHTRRVKTELFVKLKALKTLVILKCSF
ncbi:unnamed protein product [Meganyctiphanes norvegica]|uniref:AAA+ ATPase domain-containing protein n=1 Tax=Meganyctiphanes norvegica TaxID=48144 RepID=A0AAV2STS9_MEGNR